MSQPDNVRTEETAMTPKATIISEENRVAIHEVGHAVTAFLLGRRLNGISIKGEPGSLGRAHYLPDPDWPDDLASLSQQQRLEISMISAGGIAAERLMLGWPVNDMLGASSDFIQMTMYAQPLYGELSVAGKNSKLLKDTVELLSRHKSLIVGLTEALLVSKELTGEQEMSFLAT